MATNNPLWPTMAFLRPSSSVTKQKLVPVPMCKLTDADHLPLADFLASEAHC